MAGISLFDQLAGSLLNNIDKKRKVDPTNKDYMISGREYTLPSELVQAVYKHVSTNTQAMANMEKATPAKYQEFIEFKNMIRAFGTDVTPIFMVEGGALKGMYTPGIHKTTDAIKAEIGNYDICMRLGKHYLPLVFNKETEMWESVPSKGCEKILLRWDYAIVKTQLGELSVLVAKCCVNNSEKIENIFVATAKSRREDKDKKKDAYSSLDIRKAFEKGDSVALLEMLTTPSTGNGWVYRFSEEKFKFGRYPVVSLKQERRKSGNKSWLNYIVRVLDEEGTECSVCLESNQTPVWMALSNAYPWEDENGKVNEVTTDDDFFGDSSPSLKYCIVYFNKTSTTKTNDQGKTETKYYANIRHEVYDKDVFTFLSDDELKHANAGGSLPVKQPDITGVDDLIGADLVTNGKQPVPM